MSTPCLFCGQRHVWTNSPSQQLHNLIVQGQSIQLGGSPSMNMPMKIHTGAAVLKRTFNSTNQMGPCDMPACQQYLQPHQ